MAAASASERAESEEHLKGLRGRTTVLVFSMQARRRLVCSLQQQHHAEACTEIKSPSKYLPDMHRTTATTLDLL